MGLEFKNAGVISGGDMTAEAVTTKLAYLFGHVNEISLPNASVENMEDMVTISNNASINGISLNTTTNDDENYVLESINIDDNENESSDIELDININKATSNSLTHNACMSPINYASSSTTNNNNNSNRVLSSSKTFRTYQRLNNVEWVQKYLITCLRGEVTNNSTAKIYIRSRFFSGQDITLASDDNLLNISNS